MRDTPRQQTRNWHARSGSFRPFPVWHDPIVRAGAHGPGETGSRLSRAALRFLSGPLLVGALIACLGFTVSAAAAVPRATDSGPWVGLAGGRIGDVQWSVKVARPPGAASAGSSTARRPCLQVGTKLERSRFDYLRSRYQGCLDESSGLLATEEPLIVTGAQASAGLRVKLTAVGVLASRAVRRVEITYEDGRQATIHLKEPSSKQEQRAGLVRFRYAAFAIPGTWSVQRVVTESAAGRTLWDSSAGS